MSKTAEEILRANIDMSNRAESCEYVENECIKAMREFAAQEVEAYKQRLKAEINNMDDPEIWSVNIALSLIDIVK